MYLSPIFRRDIPNKLSKATSDKETKKDLVTKNTSLRHRDWDICEEVTMETLLKELN